VAAEGIGACSVSQLAEVSVEVAHCNTAEETGGLLQVEEASSAEETSTAS